ncbi:MAG: hypothetical protein EOP54_06395 [Sphingobacteriales bacterium]|nr:MAG: hypothetical protein EOP54_06395 [Sphingobacteriales bacterium]
MLLICCFLPKLAGACGPSLYPDEARFALFRNGINGQEGFEPFYYSEYFLNSNIPDPTGKDYKRNCREWQHVTGETVNFEDIYSIQYTCAPDSFLSAYEQKNWSAFKQNSFTNWLLKKKNKAYLDYFILAKQMEAAQFHRGDPWTASLLDTNTISLEQLARTALERCNKTKNGFLKTRYAFQAIKTVYYVIERDDLAAYLKAFETYIEPGQSVVKGWGYYFYGLLQQDKFKRNICLLRAFDLSEEKKVAAFNKIEPASLAAIIQQEKDPELKESALAMQGIYTMGRAGDLISALYQVNPGSKYLPLLLTREINKVEDWIWSYAFLGFSNLAIDYEGKRTFSYWNKGYTEDETQQKTLIAANRKNDLEYVAELCTLMAKMAGGQCYDKDFLELAQAHLYNIRGNYTAATRALAGLTLPESSVYYKQWLIESIIICAHTEDISDLKVQNRLLQWLRAVDTAPSPNENNNEATLAENDDDLSELFLVLSKKFQDKGAVNTAGLLYNKSHHQKNRYDGWTSNWSDLYPAQQKKPHSVTPKMNYKQIAFWDRYASPQELEALIAFKDKQHKTAFEQYISPEQWPDAQVYKDLIGTKYMRMERYHDALQVFKSMDQEFWNDNYYYADYLPFTGISDLSTYAPWDKSRMKQYKRTSKTEIVADIVAIVDQLNKPGLSEEQKARHYIQLGNCKLNMTKNGLFWMMLSYGNFGQENRGNSGNFYTYTFYPNTIAYGDNYYGAQSALEAYDQALKLSKNKEQLASVYLYKELALVLSDHVFGNKYDEKRTRTENVNMLRKYFAHTKAYEAATSYCADIDL